MRHLGHRRGEEGEHAEPREQPRDEPSDAPERLYHQPARPRAREAMDAAQERAVQTVRLLLLLPPRGLSGTKAGSPEDADADAGGADAAAAAASASFVSSARLRLPALPRARRAASSRLTSIKARSRRGSQGLPSSTDPPPSPAHKDPRSPLPMTPTHPARHTTRSGLDKVHHMEQLSGYFENDAALASIKAEYIMWCNITTSIKKDTEEEAARPVELQPVRRGEPAGDGEAQEPRALLLAHARLPGGLQLGARGGRRRGPEGPPGGAPGQEARLRPAPPLGLAAGGRRLRHAGHRHLLHHPLRRGLARRRALASPVPRPLDYAADFPADASKPASRCPSSFSSLVPPKAEKKELSRRDWRDLCDSSPSLVDLMHSLRQYQEQEQDEEAAYDPCSHLHHRHSLKQPKKAHRLQDLVDKRYEDLLPERDKKIAALMLARHQEEEEMKDRQLQVSEAWENLRRKEKKHKARLDKERRCHVADSLEQWQRDRDQRLSKLRLEEQQLLAARERDIMLRDKKWKKLAKEQECRRREKSESARLQAEYRKRCQEKQLWDKKLSERSTRDQSSHAYKEKMLQALEKRLMKEMERKRRKTDMNEYRRAQHMHNKDQMDDRLKADELYKRLCIEQKLQRSQEILEQLLEERNRELKERSLKEEEQGMIAKVRAKETEEEKRRRKEMLLQIAEMKIQQAREIMSKNIEDRAQHTKEMNCLRERNHHCRKQKLDYDEKCNLRDLQEALRRKDQKSNQILRHKDTAIEESRKLAKASYDLREKVRDLINHNSFDQMALDAHRNASVLRGL
nr:PREDICTED: coiled-coil domain-containing protein 185 [Anolis carolinensis]|eukprot:XP_008118882.1 PREDICTED: coiled-coil domain-containing protein 185 [Anolis carolinensis]